MSGYSVAQGIFPPGVGPLLSLSKPPVPPIPGQPQVVAIQSADYHNDLLFVGCDRCPTIDKLRQTLVYESEEFKQKEIESTEVFNNIERLTGTRPDMRRFYPIFDSFICLKLHGKYDLEKEDPELYKQVVRLGNWSEYQRFRSDVVGALAGSNIAECIFTQQLFKVNQSKNSRKLILYSGHDSTLMSIIAFFRLDIPENASATTVTIDRKIVAPTLFNSIPVVASAFIFELLKKKNSDGIDKEESHAVRVLFRSGDSQQTEVVRIRGCTQNKGEFCSWKEFKSYIRSVAPLDWCVGCDNRTSNACVQRAWSRVMTGESTLKRLFTVQKEQDQLKHQLLKIDPKSIQVAQIKDKLADLTEEKHLLKERLGLGEEDLRKPKDRGDVGISYVE